MAVAVLTLTSKHGSNDQTWEKYIGTFTVGAGTYVPGGLALDSFLLANLFPKSNSAPIACLLWSTKGSGYIYQRIRSTGTMMILQVPLTGSLTTAAPLVEILAGSTLSAVQADEIQFEAIYERNKGSYPF
jgi:hypothetical protein